MPSSFVIRHGTSVTLIISRQNIEFAALWDKFAEQYPDGSYAFFLDYLDDNDDVIVQRHNIQILEVEQQDDPYFTQALHDIMTENNQATEDLAAMERTMHERNWGSLVYERARLYQNQQQKTGVS